MTWYCTRLYFINRNNLRNPIEDPVGIALILALRWRELYKCTAIEWHEISPTLHIGASGALSSIKPRPQSAAVYIKCTLPITRDQLSYRGLMALTKSPVCKHTLVEVTSKESATILLLFLSVTKTHCPSLVPCLLQNGP